MGVRLTTMVSPSRDVVGFAEERVSAWGGEVATSASRRVPK
jgi:hypothetical protein